MLDVKQKPHDRPTNHLPAKQQKHTDTSAKLPQQNSCGACHNLMLTDWLSIYAYIDAHPGASQLNVVEHFHTQQEGPLIFNQSTLCCKLQDCPKVEAHISEGSVRVW